jgi:hypothetical protein
MELYRHNCTDIIRDTVKIKLSLGLIMHHAMNMYWRSGGKLHAFFTSALDEG